METSEIINKGDFKLFISKKKRLVQLRWSI